MSSPAPIDSAQLALLLRDFSCEEVKVFRACPRCKKICKCLGNAGGVRHRIRCTCCNEEWDGRVKSAEQA